MTKGVAPDAVPPKSESTFRDTLLSHGPLGRRRTASDSEVERLRKDLQGDEIISSLGVCIYAGGSLARRDFGVNSDFDPFIISDALPSRLDSLTLYSRLIQINKDHGFPPFSNDGQFLKIHDIEKMKQVLGSPRDDSENSFTARMLMVLESTPLSGTALYSTYLRSIIETYYRDKKDHKDFRPLFLLNDALRFWRTLCLNYEQIRNRRDKPWRKKNINLKFSRMLSVFGTVHPLIAIGPDESALQTLCSLGPLERLAVGLDAVGDASLLPRFKDLLDDYELFLSVKEKDQVDQDVGPDGELRQQIAEASARFSLFLFDAVTHPKIDPLIRRFLVI